MERQMDTLRDRLAGTDLEALALLTGGQPPSVVSPPR
jgi:hypothetical protein